MTDLILSVAEQFFGPSMKCKLMKWPSTTENITELGGFSTRVDKLLKRILGSSDVATADEVVIPTD